MIRKYQSREDPDLEIVEILIDFRKVLTTLIKIAVLISFTMLLAKLIFRAGPSFIWALAPLSIPLFIMILCTAIEFARGYLVDWISFFKGDIRDDEEMIFTFDPDKKDEDDKK